MVCVVVCQFRLEETEGKDALCTLWSLLWVKFDDDDDG